MGEKPRVLTGDTPPVRMGFLEGPQPLELLSDPAHQVGVDALQEGKQSCSVERTEILHPAPDDRIDRPCKLGEGPADLSVKPPLPHFTADLLLGFLADRRQKRGEPLPVPVDGLAEPGK